jgi:hypothetical protein
MTRRTGLAFVVLAAVFAILAALLAGAPRIACAQCGPDGSPPCNPDMPWLDCCEEINYVGAYDPNDKIGTPGIGVLHSVGSGPFLSYTIHFENLPAATAPAQEVRVTDALDPALFDLATFTFVSAGFADTTLYVATGLLSFSIDVDRRPIQDLIVRIEGTLSKTSGAMTVRFRSLDPTTLDPIDDPAGGFLPPDVSPPEGTGFVSFAVQAKPSLPTGTRIANTAHIVFDVNPPIDTPEWFNTIDADAPTSQVDALPPLAPRRNFGVSWGGSDVGSGVRDYAVYVSDDNGPYDIWIPSTTALADTFPGEHMHTYRFYAVARDSAGNLEAAPSLPDATTALDTTTAASPTLADVRSDGGRVRVLWFATLGSAHAAVERRSNSTDWIEIGTPSVYARDYLEFVDADVVAGERYGYRLRVETAEGLATYGEVWIAVDASLELAFQRPHPNPTTNPVLLDFTLPDDRPAWLEVFDVRGRRVVARRLSDLGTGGHRYSLADAGALRAGSYVVRLTHAGRALTQKIVVLP